MPLRTEGPHTQRGRVARLARAVAAARPRPRGQEGDEGTFVTVVRFGPRCAHPHAQSADDHVYARDAVSVPVLGRLYHDIRHDPELKVRACARLVTKHDRPSAGRRVPVGLPPDGRARRNLLHGVPVTFPRPPTVRAQEFLRMAMADPDLKRDGIVLVPHSYGMA